MRSFGIRARISQLNRRVRLAALTLPLATIFLTASGAQAHGGCHGGAGCHGGGFHSSGGSHFSSMHSSSHFSSSHSSFHSSNFHPSSFHSSSFHSSSFSSPSLFSHGSSGNVHVGFFTPRAGRALIMTPGDGNRSFSRHGHENIQVQGGSAMGTMVSSGRHGLFAALFGKHHAHANDSNMGKIQALERGNQSFPASNLSHTPFADQSMVAPQHHGLFYHLTHHDKHAAESIADAHHAAVEHQSALIGSAHAFAWAPPAISATIAPAVTPVVCMTPIPSLNSGSYFSIPRNNNRFATSTFGSSYYIPGQYVYYGNLGSLLRALFSIFGGARGYGYGQALPNYPLGYGANIYGNGAALYGTSLSGTNNGPAGYGNYGNDDAAEYIFNNSHLVPYGSTLNTDANQAGFNGFGTSDPLRPFYDSSNYNNSVNGQDQGNMIVDPRTLGLHPFTPGDTSNLPQNIPLP